MTLAELVGTLERRAAEAEREGSSAPVSRVLRAVLEDLRLLVPAEGNGNGARPVADDRLLTAGEVAALLSTTVRWVYAHAGELGGRRLSRRCVRFSEATVRRRLARV